MPLMCAAASANDLGSHHSVTNVSTFTQIPFGKRCGETRPARAAFELGACPEEGQAAQAAGIDPRPLLGEENAAKRRFRSVLEKDAPLVLV
jgi:hypothetical protein